MNGLQIVDGSPDFSFCFPEDWTNQLDMVGEISSVCAVVLSQDTPYVRLLLLVSCPVCVTTLAHILASTCIAQHRTKSAPHLTVVGLGCEDDLSYSVGLWSSQAEPEQSNRD